MLDYTTYHKRRHGTIDAPTTATEWDRRRSLITLRYLAENRDNFVHTVECLQLSFTVHA